MEIVPVMSLATDYRMGDLIEVLEDFTDRSIERRGLTAGMVLQVLLTDEEGDICYHLLGERSQEGWIRKRQRSMIGLFNVASTERQRDLRTRKASNGDPVFEQCQNCLTWNLEPVVSCTRCAKNLTAPRSREDDPEPEDEVPKPEDMPDDPQEPGEEAKDDPYGGVRGPPPGLNPATIAEDVQRLMETRAKKERGRQEGCSTNRCRHR